MGADCSAAAGRGCVTNPRQQIQQLAFLARAARWPGVGGEAVVDVAITALSPQEMVSEFSAHFALFAPANDSGDLEQPDMLAQRYTAWLAARVFGDRKGQAPVIGGMLGADGELSSQGRGILEAEVPFLEALSKLTGANGMRATCAYKSGIAPAMIDRTTWAFRQYTFECVASRSEYFHPPRRLQKSGDVLTWSLPPNRFDRLRVILRREDASTTPPATPDDGVGVTLSGDLATTVTDAAATPNAYSIFAAYDDRYEPVDGPSVERAFSVLETGSTLVNP